MAIPPKVLHLTMKNIYDCRYGGILFGISNTAATIPGMVAPYVAAALTPNVSIKHNGANSIKNYCKLKC